MKYGHQKNSRHSGPDGKGRGGPYDNKGMATNVGNPGRTVSAKTTHGKSVTIQSRARRG